MSLNGLIVWDLVRMLIFLVIELGMFIIYRSYIRDNDSYYGYKFYSRLRRYKGGGVVYIDEFGIGRSEGEMFLYNFYGIFGKRLFLVFVMEYII